MSEKTPTPPEATKESADQKDNPDTVKTGQKKSSEYGGPPGPEPTRYGDWERNGICVDF